MKDFTTIKLEKNIVKNYSMLAIIKNKKRSDLINSALIEFLKKEGVTVGSDISSNYIHKS